MKIVEKAQGKAPKFEQDLRKVIDDKSIDIVTIATPNHWHALAAIWAMQAGKDVYVEKPVSHNVSEGRRIVEAARKYNQICQAGTQSRSSTGMREAMDFLHAGKLGKVTLARGLCYKLAASIGKVDGAQPIPKTVDYDLWCGPAPNEAAACASICTTTGTGSGTTATATSATRAFTRWTRPAGAWARTSCRRSVDQRRRPLRLRRRRRDGQHADLRLRLRRQRADLRGARPASTVHSRQGLPRESQGAEELRRQHLLLEQKASWSAPATTAAWPSTPTARCSRFKGGDDHFGNFVKAVRSRKADTDLNADILEGHLSTPRATWATSAIAWAPGAVQQEDQGFGDDKEAAETLERTAEHLKDNNVPLDSTKYRLGRKLQIDPKTERFINDKEADAI